MMRRRAGSAPQWRLSVAGWRRVRRRTAGPVALLVLAACVRTAPPETRPREESEPLLGGVVTAGTLQTDGSMRLSEVARIEVERLTALGPIYTPYEVGPRLVWSEAIQRFLVETLAPVVEGEGLPVSTHALVWVLIGANGAVADAVMQTTSEVEAFDVAALKVAEGLRFVPAGVGGQPVAVWVIREISLTME